MTAASAATVTIRSQARSGAARLMAHLTALGVTQVELSRRLWVDPRTVRAWATGRARTPVAVLLLLDAWESDAMLERRQRTLFRRTRGA